LLRLSASSLHVGARKLAKAIPTIHISVGKYAGKVIQVWFD